jgi:hypothetical protein
MPPGADRLVRTNLGVCCNAMLLAGISCTFRGRLTELLETSQPQALNNPRLSTRTEQQLMTNHPGRNHRSQHASNLPLRRSPANLVGILAVDDHRLQGWPAAAEPGNDDDRELERRVRNFLAQRSVPGLRRLAVEADGDSVQLRGIVRTYYEKQLAVHCCQRVAGVLRVIDSIEVSGSD